MVVYGLVDGRATFRIQYSSSIDLPEISMRVSMPRRPTSSVISPSTLMVVSPIVALPFSG